MRVGFLLVLLLSAAVISQSEGGWLKNVWGKVKQTATKVVGWVKEHCTFRSGIHCTFRVGRKRRDTNEVLDPKVLESKNKICEAVLDNPLESEGISFQMVKDLFEEVDRTGGSDGGDDILDEEEYNQFMESMELVHYCLRKSD